MTIKKKSLAITSGLACNLWQQRLVSSLMLGKTLLLLFFFFPINKNPLGGYSELRSIFGINLQLQIQNVHRAKFKRYISFHVVVLEHATLLSCYTRKSRGARLLAATCLV